jgi:hypothetical protein
MPLDKGGTFRINPGVARMHDSAPKAPPIAKAMPGENKQPGGDKGHIELHHGPAPDGKGKFHTITHGGEARGHETLHEAHHAMNEHMGQDGCSDGSCAEHGGSGEAAAPALDTEDYS